MESIITYLIPIILVIWCSISLFVVKKSINDDFFSPKEHPKRYGKRISIVK